MADHHYAADSTTRRSCFRGVLPSQCIKRQMGIDGHSSLWWVYSAKEAPCYTVVILQTSWYVDPEQPAYVSLISASATNIQSRTSDAKVQAAMCIRYAESAGAPFGVTLLDVSLCNFPRSRHGHLVHKLDETGNLVVG